LATKNQHAILIILFCSLLVMVSSLTPTSRSLTTPSGSIQTMQSTASIGSGTFNVTLISKPTNGNTLFLTYAGSGQASNPTISSISQIGVTWAKAVSKNGSVDVEIWYGTAGANAGNTAIITVTGGSTLHVGNIADICEWANIATTNPVDKTAFNTGLSDSGDTGTTAVTSQSNELFVGAIGTTGVTDQLSGSNGYSLSHGQAETLGTPLTLAELTKISTTKETANSGTYFYPTSWTGCIAAFKSEDISPTSTATPSPTSTATPSPTSTATPSPTSTATPSPTSTNTPVPTSAPISSSTTLPKSSSPPPTPTVTSATSPLPTPTNPEFPSAILGIVTLMLVATSLLLYLKKHSWKT